MPDQENNGQGPVNVIPENTGNQNTSLAREVENELAGFEAETCNCKIDKLGLAREVEVMKLSGKGYTEIAKELSLTRGIYLEPKHIYYHLERTKFLDFEKRNRTNQWQSLVDKMFPKVQQAIDNNTMKLPSADKILDVAFKDNSPKVQQVIIQVKQTFFDFTKASIQMWVGTLREHCSPDVVDAIINDVKPKIEQALPEYIKKVESTNEDK